MNLKIFYTICLLVVFALPVSAMACDLEPWGGQGKATAEKVVKRLLKKEAPEFFGKIKIIKAKKRGDDRIDYKVKTVKQYRGEPQESFDAFSSLKTSCTFVAKEGDEYLVFLERGSEKPYQINLYDTHFFYVPMADIEAYLDAKAVTEKK